MPSGITAPIYEGDGITFEQFVWRCARQMMPLIHMRDMSIDTPITMPTLSEYHKHELAKKEAHLAALLRTAENPEYALKEMYVEYEAAMDRHIKAVKAAKEARRRIKALLARVHAWSPPSPDHQGLKDLMLKQLEQDLHYEGTYDLPEPKDNPLDLWLAKKISMVERDIHYHKEQLAIDESNHAERMKWLEQLIEVVGAP